MYWKFLFAVVTFWELIIRPMPRGALPGARPSGQVRFMTRPKSRSISSERIIGLVVEYTPATGETRVRFPDDALITTESF